MMVVDASAAVELLLGTSRGERVAARILRPGEALRAPHLIDVEIAQVVRRFVARRVMSAERGGQALEDWVSLPVDRYPHDLLLPRVWELRSNLTAYDAVYVALAEALEAPLVTCDRRLADAPGHSVAIEVY